jgi:hypothetical protein
MRHLAAVAAVLLIATIACGFQKPAEDATEEENSSSSSSSDPSPAPESTPTTYGVVGPDGTNHWIVVKCGSSPECYSRASITCPMGWSVYDKSTSTSYRVTGTSVSETTGTMSGTATTNPTGLGGSRTDMSGTVDSTTVGSHKETILPVEHGQMLVKCGSEQNDAKLIDQLKALCDDGNDKACKAHTFAVKKRGCCMWNQGARSCNDEHKIVCFDGHVSAGCSC